MSHKHFVIGISRDELFFSWVSTFGGGKIVKSKVEKYNLATAREVLQTAYKQFKFKKVRLLLAEELSYFLQVSIPKSLKGSDERNYVKEIIKNKIPEQIGNLDWDYKKLSIDSETKKLIVFAPVRSVYGRIVDTLDSMGVSIEAVEPEIMAAKRHKNPLIGLAMKKDLRGNDEDVLNVVGNQVATNQEKIGRKTSNHTKTLAVVLVLSLILLGIFASFYYFYSKDKHPVNNEIVQEMSAYSILITVGRGDVTIAEDVKDVLSYEGFGKIEITEGAYISNGTLYVGVKSGVSDLVFDKVERALNSDYSVVKDEKLSESSNDYDVYLIVGDID